MEYILGYLNLSDVINSYNKKICDNYIEENWNKYCTGNISSWEMDSLSFYYHEHELSNINKTRYNITNFTDMPEQPIVEGEYIKKGRVFSKYRLYKIVGTVLDRDKNKHIVTLLTPNGVVGVKFYSGSFIHYDKTVSTVNDGKKEIVDKSWFTRGTKLIISGIRREDRFIPKKYFDSIYNHTVCLIEDVQGEDLVLKLEREQI
jgi:DNA polymerase-3 subunit alpha